MPKQKKAKAEKVESASDNHVMSNGIVVEGNVTTGKDHKLSAKEQGQLARGEIDETGEKTGKEIENRDVRTMKPTEQLFKGKLSASAIASATGEKVSFVWVQEMPTTKKGCFWSFLQAHPSADYDTFEIDPSNTIDPTLRTSLEK